MLLVLAGYSNARWVYITGNKVYYYKHVANAYIVVTHSMVYHAYALSDGMVGFLVALVFVIHGFMYLLLERVAAKFLKFFDNMKLVSKRTVTKPVRNAVVDMRSTSASYDPVSHGPIYRNIQDAFDTSRFH